MAQRIPIPPFNAHSNCHVPTFYPDSNDEIVDVIGSKSEYDYQSDIETEHKSRPKQIAPIQTTYHCWKFTKALPQGKGAPNWKRIERTQMTLPSDELATQAKKQRKAQSLTEAYESLSTDQRHQVELLLKEKRNDENNRHAEWELAGLYREVHNNMKTRVRETTFVRVILKRRDKRENNKPKKPEALTVASSIVDLNDETGLLSREMEVLRNKFHEPHKKRPKPPKKERSLPGDTIGAMPISSKAKSLLTASLQPAVPNTSQSHMPHQVFWQTQFRPREMSSTDQDQHDQPSSKRLQDFPISYPNQHQQQQFRQQVPFPHVVGDRQNIPSGAQHEHHLSQSSVTPSGPQTDSRFQAQPPQQSTSTKAQTQDLAAGWQRPLDEPARYRLNAYTMVDSAQFQFGHTHNLAQQRSSSSELVQAQTTMPQHARPVPQAYSHAFQGVPQPTLQPQPLSQPLSQPQRVQQPQQTQQPQHQYEQQQRVKPAQSPMHSSSQQHFGSLSTPEPLFCSEDPHRSSENLQPTRVRYPANEPRDVSRETPNDPLLPSQLQPRDVAANRHPKSYVPDGHGVQSDAKAPVGPSWPNFNPAVDNLASDLPGAERQTGQYKQSNEKRREDILFWRTQAQLSQSRSSSSLNDQSSTLASPEQSTPPTSVSGDRLPLNRRHTDKPSVGRPYDNEERPNVLRQHFEQRGAANDFFQHGQHREDSTNTRNLDDYEPQPRHGKRYQAEPSFDTSDSDDEYRRAHSSTHNFFPRQHPRDQRHAFAEPPSHAPKYKKTYQPHPYDRDEHYPTLTARSQQLDPETASVLERLSRRLEDMEMKQAEEANKKAMEAAERQRELDRKQAYERGVEDAMAWKKVRSPGGLWQV